MVLTLCTALGLAQDLKAFGDVELLMTSEEACEVLGIDECELSDYNYWADVGVRTIEVPNADMLFDVIGDLKLSFLDNVLYQVSLEMDRDASRPGNVSAVRQAFFDRFGPGFSSPSGRFTVWSVGEKGYSWVPSINRVSVSWTPLEEERDERQDALEKRRANEAATDL